KVDLKYEGIQKALDEQNQILRDANQNLLQALTDQSQIDTKLSVLQIDLKQLQKSDLSLQIELLQNKLKEENQKLELIMNKLDNILMIVKHETQISKQLDIEFKVEELLSSSHHNQLISEITAYYLKMDELKSKMNLEVSESKRE